MKPTQLELAAAQCVAEMEGIPFFPTGEMARAAIIRSLVEMANQPRELAELSKRMRTHYRKWPGEAELRGVFCTFAKPRDGIESGATDAGTLAAAIEARALEAHSSVKYLAAAAPVVKQIAEGRKMPCILTTPARL